MNDAGRIQSAAHVKMHTQHQQKWLSKQSQIIDPFFTLNTTPFHFLLDSHDSNSPPNIVQESANIIRSNNIKYFRIISYLWAGSFEKDDCLFSKAEEHLGGISERQKDFVSIQEILC